MSDKEPYRPNRALVVLSYVGVAVILGWQAWAHADDLKSAILGFLVVAGMFAVFQVVIWRIIRRARG